jgi:co-chaperonin GroES (HSP10)
MGTISNLAFMDMGDAASEAARMRKLFDDGPAQLKPAGVNILAIMWVRPGRTRGGIELPDNAKEEDIYQGKISLVVSVGPDCFQSTSYRTYTGPTCKEGDWIFTDPMAGKKFQLNKAFCRLVHDDEIRGVVNGPQAIL